MKARLYETYDVMLDFGRAASIEDVYRVLLARAARYGASSVLAGIIPKTIIKPEDQPKYVVLGHWPEEWASRYFERQYVRHDPTIQHCATQIAPLAWSDLPTLTIAERGARIMNEAREFRLHDGLTIPQLTIDGERIGVSFAGDRLDHSPEAMTDLTVLSSYAVARALQIRATLVAAPVRLSARERECLLWSSEGKTSGDIGTILGVSAKAIEKHLGQARRKLNSLTTTQAVVQALKLGLLS